MGRLWQVLSLYFHRHLRRRVHIVWVVVAIVIVVWDDSRPDDLQPVRYFSQQLVSPFRASFDDLSVFLHARAAAAGRMLDQAEKIAGLEAENIRLRQWYHVAQTVLAENENLRRYFSAPFARGGGNVQHFVLRGQYRHLIDQLPRFDVAGRGQIRPNEAVIDARGLIGRVLAVKGSEAEVMLLSHPKSRVPVAVGDQHYQALLEGRAQNMAVLKYDHLPNGAKFRAGMAVQSSGYLGLLPPGLPIGKLIAEQDGEWLVKLHFDPSQLRYVAVVPSLLLPSDTPFNQESNPEDMSEAHTIAPTQP